MIDSGGQETIRRFQIYGVAVAIQTDSPEALDSFSRLYDGFPAPADSRNDILLRMVSDDAGWRVFDGDEEPFGPSALTTALLNAESLICTRVPVLRTDLLTLHGATLSTSAGGMLITGVSGAGKSTLSLALTSLGWNVCTDDYSLFDMETARVLPIPRFFHLDAHSARILKSVGVDAGKTSPIEGVVTPSDLGWKSGTPIDVRRIVYLEGGAVAEGPLIRPVSQAEMLALLTSESGREGVRWEEDLPKLARLAGRSGCFRMGRAELRVMVEELGGAKKS